MFLGKYKRMLGVDGKLIYGSKDYCKKRLKILENEHYIKRINKYYIKLDNKGTRLVREFGYDYSYKCRKKAYIDRLNEVAKIASLVIKSKIKFIASWDLKDVDAYTETSRKYIGELIWKDKQYIVYYLSNDKRNTYISQTVNDIQKIINYKNIIIFMYDFSKIDENRNFVFGRDSTLIIKPTSRNLNLIRNFEDIDFYEIIRNMYNGAEILLSNWKQADYMKEDETYIFFMPFIDTERLYRLNNFYYNENVYRKIDIITLKENIEKIKKILTKKTNIIEIDNFLGGSNDKKEEI